MNNKIFIASNNSENDIFTNMQIPEYDAQNNVATTSSTQTNNLNVDLDANIIIASGLAIALIILLAIVSKMLKPQKTITPAKQIRTTTRPTRLKEEVSEAPKPQVIQTKKQKETGDFATPKNLDKCIRLFLENTRIK